MEKRHHDSDEHTTTDHKFLSRLPHRPATAPTRRSIGRRMSQNAAATFEPMTWLTTEDRGNVRILTMDQPDRKNAIPSHGWAELNTAFDDFETSDQRVLVITGANGDFSAGADLDTDLAIGAGVADRQRRMKTIAQTALKLHRLTKPTIAAVDGVAVGAGLNLAIGCDVVLASSRARFSEIFVRRGLTLDFGGSWLLPRVVGMQRAKELALSGRIVEAHEARDIGLCLELTTPDGLMPRALEMAAGFAAQAPIAQMLAKQGLNHAWDQSLAQALDLEGQSQAICFTTTDVAEGIGAFLEKRAPEFEGH
jgi:2-(1,2-epoxy-1,2-dihydrophenyl)acetyl-CoA isomerase